MLKKTIFTLVALMLYVFTANAQSSKIVYSNAMTHFYVTLYANNEDSITYTISETSVPMKNICSLIV